MYSNAKIFDKEGSLTDYSETLSLITGLYIMDLVYKNKDGVVNGSIRSKCNGIDQIFNHFNPNYKKKAKKTKSKSNNFKEYWWVVILIGVVAFFVYMFTVKDMPKRKKAVKKISQSPGAIKKFFSGDISLATSFWGVYFFIGLIVGSVFFAIQDEVWAGYYALFILLPFRIFAIIGTWRSANKYIIEKQKKKQGTGWGTAAQLYIVFSIISSVLRMIIRT